MTHTRFFFYTLSFRDKTQAICKDITCSHFPTSQTISYYILFSAAHTRKSGLPALWVAALEYVHPLLPCTSEAEQPQDFLF